MIFLTTAEVSLFSCVMGGPRGSETALHRIFFCSDIFPFSKNHKVNLEGIVNFTYERCHEEKGGVGWVRLSLCVSVSVCIDLHVHCTLVQCTPGFSTSRRLTNALAFAQGCHKSENLVKSLSRSLAQGRFFSQIRNISQIQVNAHRAYGH